MTAEIVVVNHAAVALAADSAVTIGRSKIYNSADKLFALSRRHPVGVMIYGGATLNGIPWEITIKDFRKKLENKALPYIDDYSDEFIKYIKSNGDIFPEKIRDRFVTQTIASFLSAIRDGTERAVNEHIEKTGSIDEQTTRQIFNETLHKLISEWNSVGDLPYGSKTAVKELGKNWAAAADAEIDKRLQALASFLDKKGRKALCSACLTPLFKDRFSSNCSGVVIAGFGEKDYFPRIISHKVDGIFGTNLKSVIEAGKSNGSHVDFEPAIYPFAQDEMVHSFISGIAPNIAKLIDAYVAGMFSKFPDGIPDDLFSGTPAKVALTKQHMRDFGSQLFHDFKSKIEQEKFVQNVQPILAMVQALPKDELAAMAESLVNLTAFKRRISASMETVGGPIDVAVISKGDGFIWVKRKHYFKPELNPSYFFNNFGTNSTGE